MAPEKSRSHSSLGSRSSSHTVVTVEPRELDVLCGKESRARHHQGSRYFRAFVESYRQRYHEAKNKTERGAITKDMYDLIRGAEIRFLKFNAAANGWEEMSSTAARDKITHALKFAQKRTSSGHRKQRSLPKKQASDSSRRSEASVSSKTSKSSLDWENLMHRQQEHLASLSLSNMNASLRASRMSRRTSLSSQGSAGSASIGSASLLKTSSGHTRSSGKGVRFGAFLEEDEDVEEDNSAHNSFHTTTTANTSLASDPITVDLPTSSTSTATTQQQSDSLRKPTKDSTKKEDKPPRKPCRPIEEDDHEHSSSGDEMKLTRSQLTIEEQPISFASLTITEENAITKPFHTQQHLQQPPTIHQQPMANHAAISSNPMGPLRIRHAMNPSLGTLHNNSELASNIKQMPMNLSPASGLMMANIHDSNLPAPLDPTLDSRPATLLNSDPLPTILATSSLDNQQQPVAFDNDALFVQECKDAEAYMVASMAMTGGGTQNNPAAAVAAGTGGGLMVRPTETLSSSLPPATGLYANNICSIDDTTPPSSNHKHHVDTGVSPIIADTSRGMAQFSMNATEGIEESHPSDGQVQVGYNEAGSPTLQDAPMVEANETVDEEYDQFLSLLREPLLE